MADSRAKARKIPDKPETYYIESKRKKVLKER